VQLDWRRPAANGGRIDLGSAAGMVDRGGDDEARWHPFRTRWGLPGIGARLCG